MGKGERSSAEIPADHLSGGPQENRSRAACEVGEGAGGEEGDLGPKEPDAVVWHALMLDSDACSKMRDSDHSPRVQHDLLRGRDSLHYIAEDSRIGRQQGHGMCGE
jgi:hypothetical protein